MNVTDDIKKAVWEKAKTVNKLDPNIVRMDACGAYMVWDRYGADESPYGWEIDHIVPEAVLKQRQIPASKRDDLSNLRAMQHQNNASKGDNYPSYIAAVTGENGDNVEKKRLLRVNDKQRKALNRLYGLNL